MDAYCVFFMPTYYREMTATEQDIFKMLFSNPFNKWVELVRNYNQGIPTSFGFLDTEMINWCTQVAIRQDEFLNIMDAKYIVIDTKYIVMDPTYLLS